VVSRWSALAILVAGAACSSYGGADATPTDAGGADATPTGDAAPENDNPTPDAAEAEAEAGGANILENGDFETGCAMWKVSSGTATPDPRARSGTGACLVCFDPDAGGSANLYQIVPRTLAAGTRYASKVWVRAPTGPADRPASNAYSTIIEHYDTGTPRESMPLAFVPNDTWQHTDALLDMEGNGTSIELAITSVGGCILVDDATLSLE
jgi:hypothetical protein